MDFNKIKTFFQFSFWNVLALLIVVLAFIYSPQFSIFAVGILKFVVIITLGVVIDKFILKDFNTIEELKNGNVAVAITLVAVAILLYASIGGI